MNKEILIDLPFELTPDLDFELNKEHFSVKDFIKFHSNCTDAIQKQIEWKVGTGGVSMQLFDNKKTKKGEKDIVVVMAYEIIDEKIMNTKLLRTRFFEVGKIDDESLDLFSILKSKGAKLEIRED